MANIEYPKARKQYECSKCKAIINVGDKYVKGTPFRMKPIIRCSKCGLRGWELSSSDYVQRVGRVCDCWKEDYGISEDTAQNIADELSNLRDDIECNFDNMPENFQYGETGEMLQERMDNLDQVVSDLECIDYESIAEDAKNNVENDEELDDEIDSLLSDAIEEAISCLEY